MRHTSKEGPKTVLVRVHSYADKERIIYVARKGGTINIDGANVSFHQDFSMGVVRKRKELANAHKLLREAGIPYSCCNQNLSSQWYQLFLLDYGRN